MRTQHLLVVSVLLVAGYFGGRAVLAALASDETKIGQLFADEAAAFNASAAMSVLANFGPDWRDETAGLSRQDLQRGLLWLFQNRRDPGTRRFLHRVAVGELTVDVQGERAAAVVPLVLYQGLDAEERTVWELRVAADLGKRDGSWRIERSRHETLSGGMPR